MKQPWVEQYRPKTLSSVIFSDPATKTVFKSFLTKGLPNLLLYGPPGTGKTSTSSSLLNDLDIDAADRLRINCSDEKIDAMRDKVRTFAYTMPMNSPFKVVQLEEMDHLSLDAQALLRSLIEDTSGGTRFIGTCNYVNKIIPPLRSRFQEHKMEAPSLEAVIDLTQSILAEKGVKADPEVLGLYIETAYPDVRKVIQLLEQNAHEGVLQAARADRNADWKYNLLLLLQGSKWQEARKLVCETVSKEEVQDVYRLLYTKVETLCPKHVREAIVLIAQYQFQHGLVADTEINLAALFCELELLG